MTKYIAFHNDPALQARMLAAVDAHVKHDQVIQATGYGAAVAASAHQRFAAKLVELIGEVK